PPFLWDRIEAVEGFCWEEEGRRFAVFSPFSSMPRLAAAKPVARRMRGVHFRGGAARRTAGGEFELGDVMRAADFDLSAVHALQLAQALLIPQSRAAILFHHGLVEAQAGRALRLMRIHFVLVKVGITREQQPARLAVHRDTG